MLLLLCIVIPGILGKYVFRQHPRYQHIHFNLEPTKLEDAYAHRRIFPNLDSYRTAAQNDTLEMLKKQELKKGRSCKGFNFYKRCQKKYVTEKERLECRMARCSDCIYDDYKEHCPLCPSDNSIFCPALEACSCPWKAGFGLWESCRDAVTEQCHNSSAFGKRRMRRRRKKSSRHAHSRARSL